MSGDVKDFLTLVHSLDQRLNQLEQSKILTDPAQAIEQALVSVYDKKKTKILVVIGLVILELFVSIITKYG